MKFLDNRFTSLESSPTLCNQIPNLVIPVNRKIRSIIQRFLSPKFWVRISSSFTYSRSVSKICAIAVQIDMRILIHYISRTEILLSFLVVAYGSPIRESDTLCVGQFNIRRRLRHLVPWRRTHVPSFLFLPTPSFLPHCRTQSQPCPISAFCPRCWFDVEYAIEIPGRFGRRWGGARSTSRLLYALSQLRNLPRFRYSLLLAIHSPHFRTICFINAIVEILALVYLIFAG